MPTTPPNSFNPGTTIQSAQVNDNFDTVADAVDTVSAAIDGLDDWNDYTPTLGTTPTMGSASIAGRYAKVNDRVAVRVRLSGGSGFSGGSGTVNISLPEAPAGDNFGFALGAGVLYDGTNYHVVTVIGSASGVNLVKDGATALLAASDLSDLTASDRFLSLALIYEAGL